MPAAAAPPTRADFPLRRPVATRWADNDLYGHVNNAVYYQYFDSVINAHMIEAGGLDIQHGREVAFIVRSSCDFLAPVAYPQELELGVAVARLGGSSVQWALGLFVAGREQAVALGRMVHVFVGRDDSRPRPIPARIRAALEPLVHPAHQPEG